MTKFFLGFTLALLLVAIVIIAFMAAPNTRPPRGSKRQPVVRDESKYSEWREAAGQ